MINAEDMKKLHYNKHCTGDESVVLPFLIGLDRIPLPNLGVWNELDPLIFTLTPGWISSHQGKNIILQSDIKMSEKGKNS